MDSTMVGDRMGSPRADNLFSILKLCISPEINFFIRSNSSFKSFPKEMSLIFIDLNSSLLYPSMSQSLKYFLLWRRVNIWKGIPMMYAGCFERSENRTGDGGEWKKLKNKLKRDPKTCSAAARTKPSSCGMHSMCCYVFSLALALPLIIFFCC